MTHPRYNHWPPPCQDLCLGESPQDMLSCVLSAQVVSALSSPKEGPRNLRTWSEVSCHSGPPSTQKMALSSDPDPDFDPNTILQTQDRLSQDYESLWAVAKVTCLVQEIFEEYLLGPDPEPGVQRQSSDWTCSLPSRSLHRQRRRETGRYMAVGVMGAQVRLGVGKGISEGRTFRL